MSEFQFPDEQEVQNPSAVNKGEEVEIEVVDDTPEPDKGRAPMKEPPADVTEDELSQYSEGVKKRIQHFTKGYHDERRAKEAALREREEAIKIAQNIFEENKRLKNDIGQGHTALIDQAKLVVNSEIEDAKRRYRAAYEAGDADALVEAQEALTSAKIRSDKVNNFKPALQEPETVVQTQNQPERAAPVHVDTKAKDWQEKNPWFGSNEEMTAIALTVHKNLVENGIDPTSDAYYEKINSRVRQLFPESFDDASSSDKAGKVVKKSNVDSSAVRSTAPRKIVLTQSQVTIAKRLGVPLELYAKQVAEQMRKNNG